MVGVSACETLESQEGCLRLRRGERGQDQINSIRAKYGQTMGDKGRGMASVDCYATMLLRLSAIATAKSLPVTLMLRRFACVESLHVVLSNLFFFL